MLLNIFTYLISFFAIWAGSGLIVSSITKLSQKLKISSFLVSFVILGLLTSIPELAVGLSSVASNNPSIFVGNLLGGIPILFLFVIPLLAILGKGIRLQSNLSHEVVILSVIVSILPFIAVFDGKVTNAEGVILIGSYLSATIFLQYKQKIIGGTGISLLKVKKYSYVDIIKVLLGTAIVLVSSNIIVSKTIYFSQIFDISPFYISLFALSFGTNLPEISIAIRSIISGKKEIAFGDYLGSASANTILFGLFTLMIKGPMIQVDGFRVMFLVMLVGLLLFYFFSRSKQMLSGKEGVILLFIYIIFVVLELREYIHI